MHKLMPTTHGLVILAAGLLGACGSSDNGSNTNPVNGAAGTTAFAGNTGAAGKSSVAGNSGSTAAVGGTIGASGTSGVIAFAGRSGSVAGAGGADEEDGGTAGAHAGTSGTGVAGSLAAGSGAAGSMAGSGSAGQAGGAAGHSGQAGSSAGQGGSGAAAATFTQVYKIFMTNCAGSTCHVQSTRAADGLSMNDKMTAYMNLVGASSVSCMGLKRVVAGSSSTSELVNTLNHTAATGCFNTPRMPDGKPMLSKADIDIVTSWIDAGALNN